MTQRDTAAKPRGFHLFTIAGIRIIIDYSWFIVFFLVVWSLSAGYFPHRYPGESSAHYWTAGIFTAVAFFLSILGHELSHSFMAIRSGIQIPSITLFLFGGVSELSQEAQDPQTELKVAIVGPVSSFVFGLAAWVISRQVADASSPLVPAVFTYLAFINIAVGVFNLVPGFPLDGGRVLRALWWWRTGSLTQATRVATDMGKGFALVLMFLGGLMIFQGNLLGGIWLIFIGMFLRGVAQQGYQELVVKQSLQGVQVGEVMIQDVVSVSPDLSLKRLVSDYFMKYGYRGFPVVDGGKPLGVVSVGSIRDVPEEHLSERTVADVLRPLDDGLVVAPDAPLIEALKKMAPAEVGRLIVLEGGRMVGLITKTGLVRFLEMRRILREKHAD